MTTPRRGFKAWAVRAILGDMPGLTSEEYARTYLDKNPDGSNSQNVDPLWSLQTTLDKEYREGRMPGIKKDNGRYYPSDYPVDGQSHPRNETRVVIMLPDDALKDVDLLVEVARRSQSEAVIWLMEEGRKARRSDLDALRHAYEEIERLRESARELI